MANTKITTAVIKDDAVTSAKIADDVALGGNPTTTTQSAGNNTTRIATTAFVTTAVANLVDSAPASLNTLNELAAAMNDNASFFSTVLPLSGGTMTGALVGTTATFTTAGNTAQLVLKSTDDDAAVGPRLDLTRDSASPADNDVAGQIRFMADNDAGASTSFGFIRMVLSDVSDGAESGLMRFDTQLSGTNRNRLQFTSAEAVFNEDSQDLNFRVESATKTHMLFVDAGNNRVAVGTSNPATNLHVANVNGNTGFKLDSQNTSTGITSITFHNGGTGNPTGIIEVGGTSSSSNGIIFKHGNNGSEAERMRITSAGSVGIGTDSPTAKKSSTTLQVNGNVAVGDNNATGILAFGDIASADVNVGIFRGATGAYTNTNGNSLNIGAYDAIAFNTGNADIGSQTERMRILANGTLLVGKTADDNSVGFKTNTSSTYMVASGQTPTFINRLASAGNLLEFRYANNTVGSIGNRFDALYIHSPDGTNGAGLRFFDGVIQPCESNGNDSDADTDLGQINSRFRDLRLSRVMYSGSARIGTTTQQGTVTIDNEAVNTCLTVHQTSTSVNYAPINVENEFVTGGSTGAMAFFKRADGTIVGSITSTITATAFNTGSDQRLKENIADADESGSKIDAIQVRQFDWIVDGTHQDYGMVAQELQAVAPEAVLTPEDPNEMMGVDYSKLVPMLIKEIQSLRARVAQLETLGSD